jgi:hypothetical protein
MIVEELAAKLGLDVEMKGFSVASSLIEGLKQGWVKAGLSVLAVAGGMLELARETANAAAEADKAAQRTGLTAESFQELNYAAKASGVSQDELENALNRMSRAAYAAQHGSQAAAESFHGLLSINDLKKGKPDELLMKLADGFKGITNQQEKTARITAIFGRGMNTLIPMLNKGSEGIAHLREEAHEMGLVLDRETIANAKEFRKTLREGKEMLEAWSFAIGARVLHALVLLQRGVNSARDAIQRFRKEHEKGIWQALKFALIAVTAATIAWAIVNAGAIATAVVGFIEVITWYGALAIAAVANAARVAAAWLVANWPFVLMAIAIAAVLLVLEDLYQFMTGGKSVIGDFVKYIQTEFGGFKGFFSAILDWLKDLFMQGLDWIGEAISNKITKWKNDLKGMFGGSRADATLAVNGSFGAGASAAGAVAAGAGGPPLVNAPVKADITINAPPGGSDAGAVADTLVKRLSDHQQTTYWEAYQAIL